MQLKNIITGDSISFSQEENFSVYTDRLSEIRDVNINEQTKQSFLAKFPNLQVISLDNGFVFKPIVEADRVRLAAEAQDYRKKANDLLMNGQEELAKDMLINQVYNRTRDIVAVDPTWSYTWLGADGKERQSAFLNAMAESELTVGHPLLS